MEAQRERCFICKPTLGLEVLEADDDQVDKCRPLEMSATQKQTYNYYYYSLLLKFNTKIEIQKSIIFRIFPKIYTKKNCNLLFHT